MAGVLDSVNQRTQLVGHNRLELLLFRLKSSQVYGINVFKVKEVLQCPPLTALPKSHPVVRGVAHIRETTIPILDLSLATGNPALDQKDNLFVIITEYNMSTQGFLVNGVERIVNMNWEDMLPPPKGTGKDHYLTAVTRIESKIVEIIDVEKVLAEVAPRNESVSEGIIKEEDQEVAQRYRVIIADDSKVARRQLKTCLEEIGVEVVVTNDGKEALEHLLELAESGVDIPAHYVMMISDVEMPEMDGYTLTTACRQDNRLSGLYIMLHTSLSGVFNKAMVEKVGADNFLAKYNADQLAAQVLNRIHAYNEEIQNKQ